MFNEGTWNNPIWVQGYLSNHREIDVHHNVVGNGYFSAMGIPLLAGRTFGPQDTATSPNVGIISETMARTLFPDGSPIGRRYGRSSRNAGDIEVVGVVKDVKYNSLDEAQQPGDYLPYAQNPRYLSDFEVRYSGDSASAIRAIRQVVHEVDRNLPISEITTFNDHVARSVSNQQLVAKLSTFFSLSALLLCCIGIYGLMSYLVARRTNEIGIRMALGAERSQVLWLVIREILLLGACGVAIGIPTSMLGDRLVASLLFGFRGTDSVILLGSVGLLVIVAGIAGFLPARRAAFIDPMVALRYE
jgi:predicted permease